MNNLVRFFQLILLIFISSCNNSVVDFDKYNINSPDLNKITIHDNFWNPIIKINREVTIPYAFGKCEETGRIDNFAIAGGLKKGKHLGERYNDTDVYKIIERACYSLMQYPDPELESYVDSLIDLIRAVQESDGYLYTSRTINPGIEIPGSGSEKWSYVWISHELYNGLISGISLSGKEFFYPNPLESFGGIQRSPWFGVVCCPGNITRFLASMPSYIYAFNKESLYINLFVASSAELVINDQNLKIVQKTNYPWEGNMSVDIYPELENEFILAIRLPDWTEKKPLPGSLYKFTDLPEESVEILVNGKNHQTFKNKGYICLKKKWKYGDRVEVIMPMPVRLIKSRPQVNENTGKLAVSRGPIVYCDEEIDNDFDISDCRIPEKPEFSTNYKKDMLGGITTVSTDVYIKKNGKKLKKKLTVIPYFRWANRTPGKMIVWIDEERVEN